MKIKAYGSFLVKILFKNVQNGQETPEKSAVPKNSTSHKEYLRIPQAAQPAEQAFYIGPKKWLDLSFPRRRESSEIDPRLRGDDILEIHA